jgi:DNA repair protein RecO (recombination protein O)
MDWSDKGYVLSAKMHGEHSLIITLLTQQNGRNAGLVRGGASQKHRALYQPGNLLSVSWRARLPEHLGTYNCEMMRSHASDFLHTHLPLLALSSAVTLLDGSLPEREPVPELFALFENLLVSLKTEKWASAYIFWEIELLASLGFGLDFSECAVTGVNENLTHVSPRSGRSVSAGAALPYLNKLLALPRFLIEKDTNPEKNELIEGFMLTGYFLRRHVLGDLNKPLPATRERLIQGLT